MRDGWEIRKLGDLTTALNGLWVGKKPPFVNIAVIRNTNFTKDCQLDTTDIAYIDAEVKHFSTRKLQCGDIIIEKSGGSDKQPVGRPVLFNIPEGEFSFSNFTSTLRINDQSEILPSFLHKALWAIYRSGKTANLQSKTTGIRNLDFKSYLKLPIPVPPIAEQEKIVAELDYLTGIIEKKKRQLEELDKLAQSIFYDMFGDPITNEKGWEVKLVREIASVKIGPFGSLLHAADYITGGCPVINPVHMREGRICAEADFTVSEEKRNEMSSYLLERNDIIFGRRGDIGRCALVSATEAGYICGTGSLFVRFTTPIIPIFALSVFMSNEMKDLLVGQAKGATMLNINCGIVEQLPVIVPPLDRQNEFAKKIEAIEKQKELVKRSIVETETLFNSRMDYWFN